MLKAYKYKLNPNNWAEDHGYYHWKCRDCGLSGWTDTTPDCACQKVRRLTAHEFWCDEPKCKGQCNCGYAEQIDLKNRE